MQTVSLVHIVFYKFGIKTISPFPCLCLWLFFLFFFFFDWAFVLAIFIVHNTRYL